MNKLVPTAALAAVLALTACGGGSTEGSPAGAVATSSTLSVDASCDQLFDKGDEGRMFAAVHFLAKLPDELSASDLTKAKILATDLEYVAGTADATIKPQVDAMAKPLSELAAMEGKHTFDPAGFKAAGNEIINLCPDQAGEYNSDQEAAAAVEKAAADIAARKAADEAAAKAAAEAKAAADAAAAAPKDYSGFGDDVVNITKHAKGPAVLVIQHTGGSNFAVHSLDGSLESNDLLVNEIGPYSGTVILDGRARDESAALKITAGGAWTISLKPLTGVKSFDGSAPMSGHGDDVFYYKGPSKAATFAHNGSSNIAVKSFGTRSNLLVNEIGAYTGTVVWAPGLYQVTADGHWTATLK